MRWHNIDMTDVLQFHFRREIATAPSTGTIKKP